MPHEPGHEALRNYENPAFWKRGAETFATTLRIASFIPLYAPVAGPMRAAAAALDTAASKATNVESGTVLPSQSPIAPLIPQQVIDIVEGQMGEHITGKPPKEPKKKRKVSKSQKNFGKALKEAKKKHPRLAKSKTNSARRQLFKTAWKLAKKMK